MTATLRERPVRLPVDGAEIAGDLVLPREPRGIVLFAHGSGSSRFSPRNRFVASALHESGLGTLLIDLLTRDEEAEDARTAALRFDVRLLAARLDAATEWLEADAATKELRIGYFGASTGAAAALIAAARRREIAAVVSRGGRPDLAGDALDVVGAPTLLIVGGRDLTVLDLNRRALERLHGPKELAVVPGVTHLFEEPGALEEVARVASGWFLRHLAARPA